jgi:DNA segregation ATPase FtsK/SpoIIIE-like protein
LPRERTATIESAAGYVYVLINRSMPRLVKVGRASRAPADRISGLSGAAVELDDEDDAFFEERDALSAGAAELCVRHQKSSAKELVRYVRINYGRAAGIIEQLQSAGILGPPDGSGTCEVRVTAEEAKWIVDGREARDWLGRQPDPAQEPEQQPKGRGWFGR